MNTVLIITTVASIAVALAMSALALRLLKDERRRSAARIAALEAQLASGAPDVERPSPAPQFAASSVGLTPGLFEPIDATASDLPALIGRSTGMFAASVDAPRRGGLAFGVLVAAVVACSALGIVYWATTRDEPATPSTVDVVEDPTIELVALRHSRSGRTWSITGLVKNRGTADDVRGVAAVAFLFDREGSVVATAGAPLEIPVLAPGEASPFVVSLTTDRDVTRYRVSFRAPDGRMIRHLDSRTPVVQPATTAVRAGGARKP
jgi:hypothetical protein